MPYTEYEAGAIYMMTLPYIGQDAAQQRDGYYGVTSADESFSLEGYWPPNTSVAEGWTLTVVGFIKGVQSMVAVTIPSNVILGDYAVETSQNVVLEGYLIGDWYRYQFTVVASILPRPHGPGPLPC